MDDPCPPSLASTEAGLSASTPLLQGAKKPRKLQRNSSYREFVHQTFIFKSGMTLYIYSEGLVYKAEVTTKDNNDRKTCIGMRAMTFKDRYRITKNHSMTLNTRTILNFRSMFGS